MNFKSIIRTVLILFRFDLTKNLKYDRLTNVIMKKVIKPGSNCIDIGCHKGELLEIMIKLSPDGTHFAFEPIPYLYDNLRQKYGKIALILPFALSDNSGKSTFQFVKNAPAYSGLVKRRYDTKKPEIVEITVEKKILDEIVPSNIKIDFIKIDVEGGEFDVLKGARKILIKNKPVVIFECGMGASDFYGTSAPDIYNFLTVEIGLKISTLQAFVSKANCLNLNQFEEYFKTNKEYYFVAHL
jgi:FkbM family methyltransferase